MALLLHTVVETSSYLLDAQQAGLSQSEREYIVSVIAADPEQGDLVQGSGGVRKARIAGRGKGKSGGYRVMVAYVDDETPAYILALLSKGDRANFSRAEITEMKSFTVAIKQYWRSRRKR